MLVKAVYEMIAYENDNVPLIDVAEKVVDHIEKFYGSRIISKEKWEQKLKEEYEKEMEILLNETKSTAAL